eukprot:sb/3473855/
MMAVWEHLITCHSQLLCMDRATFNAGLRFQLVSEHKSNLVSLLQIRKHSSVSKINHGAPTEGDQFERRCDYDDDVSRYDVTWNVYYDVIRETRYPCVCYIARVILTQQSRSLPHSEFSLETRDIFYRKRSGGNYQITRRSTALPG